jgi:hypothetical protein
MPPAVFELMELRGTWGGWLSRFPWHHFATLTYRVGLVVPGCPQRLFNKWTRHLERRCQKPVQSVVVIEQGSFGGLIHQHALLHGTADLNTEALEKSWLNGYAHVRRYDPAKGAAYYLTKSVCRGRCEIEFSDRLSKLM